MSNPRIEAVARAIFLAHPLSEKSMVDACWDLYENEATAAVAALDAADIATVIATPRGLLELPKGSVIITLSQYRDRTYEKEDDVHWLETGVEQSWSAASIELPARVIHWGKA